MLSTDNNNLAMRLSSIEISSLVIRKRAAITSNVDMYIRTVATRPVLGLSPLDDVRHQHHRFLLLHHLARLLARSTFTRHREPIYPVDLFFLFHAHTHRPDTHTTPCFFLSLSLFFLFQTELSPRRVISQKSFLPQPSVLFLPPRTS